MTVPAKIKDIETNKELDGDSSLQSLNYIIKPNEKIPNYGDNDNAFLYSIKSKYNIEKDMKEQIKKTLNQHKLAFILTWALPLLMVVIGECEIYPQGLYQGNAQMEYILQSVGILLTIGLIPFALRIFSLNLVKRIQELPLAQSRPIFRCLYE